MAHKSDLPKGTVTFLMTDVERSTALWQERPAEMGAAIAAHDAVIAACVRRHGGVPLKNRGEGDSTFNVFDSAVAAVAAAADILREMSAGPSALLRVRVAVHTGDAGPRDGDYFSPAANVCSRIREAAHGGQSLISATSAALCTGSLPQGMELCSLGTFCLRDVAEPVALTQLVAPALADSFPPLRARPAADDRLPPEFTTFVGRESEVEEVMAALGRARVLTLIGVAGVGKTRLAIQVARRMAPDFRDGAFWVDLAAQDSPELVAQSVADALGLHAGPAHDLGAAIVAWLRDRACLLVLDNCEHVLDACVWLAQRVLVACPKVRLLATSREALGLYGESVWPVPSLSLPRQAAGGAADLDAVRASDAVRLFVDRARLRDPRFDATDASLSIISDICRQLEGLPLSIELVAAKTGVLPLAEIAARATECFGLVTASQLRQVPERHRSLHAAVAWSYDSLGDRDAFLFRRLSALCGRFGIAAAAALCQETDGGTVPDLLAALARLHDKSMVVAEPTGHEARFRLLEPLRQFGREKLDQAGETDQVLLLHLEYFAGLVAEAEPNLRSEGRPYWIDRLDDAASDLRAALRWASEKGQIELGLRLASSAWRYWYIRGRLREGRDLLDPLLAAGTEALPPQMVAKALHAAGTLSFYMGDYARAHQALERSLDIRRGLGDPIEIAASLNNLGFVNSESGNYDAACAFYRESIELKRSHGDRLGEAGTLGNLASLYVQVGKYGQAAEAADRSLELGRAVDDEGISVIALEVKAHIAEDRGDFQLAERLAQESLAIARSRGLAERVAGRTLAIGNLHLIQGRLEAAGEWLNESLKMQRDAANRRGIAQALTLVGEYEAVSGHAQAARADLQEARELLGMEGRPSELATCHLALARAHLMAGDLRLAQAELEAGLQLSRSFGYRLLAIRLLEAAANVEAASGDFAGAMTLVGAAEAARKDLCTPLPPLGRDEMAKLEAAARTELGHNLAAAARSEGAAVGLEAAMARALGEETA